MEQVVEAKSGQARLFTFDFILLCVARFAFFGSMSFLLPVLPLYVTSIGGTDVDVGLVTGAFTISVVTLSPIVGRAADEFGRKGLMILGTFIYVAAGIFYNFAGVLPLLLLVRLFHGSGLANFNTASSAYVADISPVSRRGEAMGYFGMATNVAMAIAPAIAMVVVDSFGFSFVFVLAAITAAIAVVTTLPLTDKHKRAVRTAGQPRPALFHPKAFFPSGIMASLGASYGAVISFLPLFAVNNDAGNPGLFFTAYAIVLIASRTISGILSDRLGRAAVIIPGLAMSAIGIWVLSFADSMAMLLVVALIYGIGFGAVQPTLMAFTVDRVGTEGRGAAMGTLGASFDVGISFGSVVMGFILQYVNFTTMFLLTGFVPLLGMFGFIAGTHLARRAGSPEREKVV